MSVAINGRVKPKDDQAPTPYRFSVRQYHRLVESGILTTNDRAELLEGLIVKKTPHSPLHDGTIGAVQGPFWDKLPDGWLLRIQSAVTLDDSEPEPDPAIVRGPAEQYFLRHPVPRDIGLLIEVAETALVVDRGQKFRLYARNRVPVYWVVNLKEDQIEVYTLPRAGKKPGYRRQQDFTWDDSVPLVLAGHEIARIPVRELLPPKP